MELFQTIAAVSGLIPPVYFMVMDERLKRAQEKRYGGLVEYHRFAPDLIEQPMLFNQDGQPFRIESVVVDRSESDPNRRNFYLYITEINNTRTVPTEEVGEVLLRADIQEDGSSLVDLGLEGGSLHTVFGSGNMLRFNKLDFGVELAILNGDQNSHVDTFSVLEERYVDPALTLDRGVKARALLGLAGLGIAALAEALGTDLLRNHMFTFSIGVLAHSLQHGVSNYSTWRKVQDAMGD